MKLSKETFTSIVFDTDTKSMTGCTNSEYLRYLKGKFSNLERFKSRYVDPFYSKFEKYKENLSEEFEIVSNFLNFLVENFDDAKPFSIEEAFKINEREFQALVFSSINIPDMVKELGAVKYKVDGIETTHKRYDENGEYLYDETYQNIYEVYKVNGTKIGINDDLYMVKCWCTTTNKEHYLWIDEKYKDDPLEAIASTFVVHENIIPFIKCLKRQGDVLIAEMIKDVKPEGNMISLTKKQYFSLLATQS